MDAAPGDDLPGAATQRRVACPDCHALVPAVDGPTHACIGGNDAWSAHARAIRARTDEVARRHDPGR
jgi:hypothetical protein